MFDINATVISQYSNSPALTSMIASWNAAIDPTVNLQNFYNQWWNIETAVGAGLDNWGTILGVTRYLEVPSIGEFVGFYNTEIDYQPMSQAPFFVAGTSTSLFALPDAQYRQLLLAKALANISICSTQALNALAQAVFGAGAMYVNDEGNMQMQYVFTSTPSAIDLAIAENSGVLPHPTGVAVEIVS